MRNLKLTIAYDGTEFHGWQSQPGLSTVQAELETALAKLFNHEVAVNGSGRTDAGVHSRGQVANVHTIRTIDIGAVLKGSNGLLPASIRVLKVEEVDEEFHARVGLSPVFSSPEIERLRTLGINAGAQALKICGAGGGGCAFLWCPPDKRSIVEKECQQAGFQVLRAKPTRVGLEIKTS